MKFTSILLCQNRMLWNINTAQAITFQVEGLPRKVELCFILQELKNKNLSDFSDSFIAQFSRNSFLNNKIPAKLTEASFLSAVC